MKIHPLKAAVTIALKEFIARREQKLLHKALSEGITVFTTDHDFKHISKVYPLRLA